MSESQGSGKDRSYVDHFNRLQRQWLPKEMAQLLARSQRALEKGAGLVPEERQTIQKIIASYREQIVRAGGFEKLLEAAGQENQP